MTDASQREPGAQAQRLADYLTALLVPAARATARAARGAGDADPAYSMYAETAAAAADEVASAVIAIAGPQDAVAKARRAGMIAERVAASAVRAANVSGSPWIADPAREAGRMAYEATVPILTDRMRAVPPAVMAAQRALREAERVFTALDGRRRGPRVIPGTVRPPGVLTRRLLAAGCALLPARDRARYTEEWESLLSELPTRRARAGHVLSILSGAPRQAWTLRRPPKDVPSA